MNKLNNPQQSIKKTDDFFSPTDFGKKNKSITITPEMVYSYVNFDEFCEDVECIGVKVVKHSAPKNAKGKYSKIVLDFENTPHLAYKGNHENQIDLEEYLSENLQSSYLLNFLK